jgi:hypothetical protein
MIGEIGEHNACAPSCPGNRGRKPFGILARIVSVQHDTVTNARERKSDSRADAPARTSDEGRARYIFCNIISHAEQSARLFS